MAKPVHVCALLMFISYTLCNGQNQTDLTNGASKPETKETITSNRQTSLPAGRANFSGEWKLNESKSEFVGQFPLCIFGGGDRMRSKTMKISRHADFLAVDVASSSLDGALVTRQEKLTFDGKAIESTFVGTPREKSTAKWLDDGQTIVVNSIRSFDTDGEKADFKVVEVWKLINDGNSISVLVNSKSISGENTMKLVYDRQKAADYRF